MAKSSKIGSDQFSNHIEISYKRARERFSHPPTPDEVMSMYMKFFPTEWAKRMRSKALIQLRAEVIRILTKGKTLTEWAPVLELQGDLFRTVPEYTQFKYAIPTKDGGIVIKYFTEVCTNDLICRSEMLSKQIDADVAAKERECD